MAANSLQNLAIDAFRAACTVSYQTGSKLRMAVDTYTGIEALTWQMPSTGYTDTGQRESTEEINPDDAGSWKPVVQLEPMESFTYIDKQDQAITNAQWMAKQGTIRGKAVGRRMDGLILNAAETWNDAAFPGPVGAAGTPSKEASDALTIETAESQKILGKDITKGVAALMDQDVGADDPESCFLVMPAARFDSLAEDLKANSFDWSGQSTQVAATAKFREIYGCTPIFIGNAQLARRAGHGKIPANRFYIWAKSSLALVIGTIEELGIVEFIQHRRSWMVGAEANAGAGRQLNNGIVKFTIKT